MYKRLLILPLLLMVNPSYSMSRVLSSKAAVCQAIPKDLWLKEVAKHKPTKNGPVMAGICYWTVKIGLWSATVLTAGTAIKKGADSMQSSVPASNGLVRIGESVAVSGVKVAAAHGLGTCSAELIATEALAWGGGPASGVVTSIAIPAINAAATANPVAAGYFTDAAQATTFAIATESAAAPTIVTAKTIVVGAATSYAAQIEACAVAAGEIGMMCPWF